MDKKLTDKSKILGIDIGGTSIKSAIVDMTSLQLLSEPIIMPTPQPASPDFMLPILQEIVHKLNWDGSIGCGFPGVIKDGIVHTAANLDKKWLYVNLKKELQKFTSIDVRVINDADAAALAEMAIGAGKDYNKIHGGVVFLITLGTGIGSALFIDGHLVPNTEFGHMKMSGKEAEKLAATVIREKENLSWETWGHRVNDFLHSMELLISPDVIIIGGGVSENPEKFFRYLNLRAKVIPAQMANNAGIIGAALQFVNS
jgi:polyphosphate glucokinase